MIDAAARVHPDADIGNDVSIGPWSTVEADVEIGAGTKIDSHVVIKGPTRIGCNNNIYPFCSIGDASQDKKYDGTGGSRLEIGDNNTIREYCSINRGSEHGGGLTKIGNNNWIMAYCHIAHDCFVGSHTVFANNATLGGHVEIHNGVVLGGFTGVHQFCRLGENCFTSISTVVIKDVPPYVLADGNTARPRGINQLGLQRRGVSTDDIQLIRRAYKVLYREGNGLSAALDKMVEIAEENQHIRCMADFIRSSDRGSIR